MSCPTNLHLRPSLLLSTVAGPVVVPLAGLAPEVVTVVEEMAEAAHVPGLGLSQTMFRSLKELELDPPTVTRLFREPLT